MKLVEFSREDQAVIWCRVISTTDGKNQFDIYELTDLTSRNQECATYFVSVTGLRTALNTTITIQHVNIRENLLYFGAKRKQ